jgi:hypothetical protein
VISSLHARQPLEVEHGTARETKAASSWSMWGSGVVVCLFKGEKGKVVEDNDMRKVGEEMGVIDKDKCEM